MVRPRAVVLLGLLLAAPAWAGALELKPHGACRDCHSDIFKLWKNSLHANSFTNPTFQAAYLSVMIDQGKEVTAQCLRCHAPLAYAAHDYEPRSPRAAEGVGCSFCHSIAAVRGGQIDTCYVLDSSSIVYGPYRPSMESGHDVRYSPLHLEARLCVGCHEFTNPAGVNVLETYSEWLASPYPENEVHCQNCHMPIMYDLKVADNYEVSNYYVTAHEFQGGHSNINLSSAVVLKSSAVRVGRMLKVEVHITNAESGHKLPTGVPVRKLVLTVTMKTGEHVEVSSARKVYRKTLTDKYGTILETVPDMFLKSTAIYSDNRIKPKETRVEHFTFEIPKWMSNYRIETILTYEYHRPILSEELVRVEMARYVIKASEVD